MKEKISAVSTIESRNISEYGKQIEDRIFADYIISKHRPAKIQQVSKRASEINFDDSSFNNNNKSIVFSGSVTLSVGDEVVPARDNSLRVRTTKRKERSHSLCII